MPYARQMPLHVREVDGEEATLNLNRLDHGPYAVSVSVSVQSALQALGIDHLTETVEDEHGPDLDVTLVLDERAMRVLRDRLDAALGERRETVPACFA